MLQVMWNTSFSVVFIYNYLSLSQSHISASRSRLHWPHCSLHVTTQHSHFQAQTEQTRMSVAGLLSLWLFYRSHFSSPVRLVCLFCVMFSRKVDHEPPYCIFKVHMVLPLFYFASLCSSELCQSVPICPQSRGQTLSHPAPCSMHFFVLKVLWALAWVHNVMRDSDYKTLVTMLTKAHVISAVVFVVFIWRHIVLLWSYVTVQPSSVRKNGQKLWSRKYCTCLWHIRAVQGVPGSNLASVIIHSLLSSPL